MRIRKAMNDDGTLLRGIVEMDETYVGVKPRKSNNKDDEPNKRGRGTKKTLVVGMMERNGKVKASLTPDLKLTLKNISKLVRHNIDIDDATLITDEFTGYMRMSYIVDHQVINHQVAFSDGDIHTNSIESFWAVLKRGIIGQFHKVSVKYLPKYMNEFCYRFSARKFSQDYLFDSTINNMLLLT